MKKVLIAILVIAVIGLGIIFTSTNSSQSDSSNKDMEKSEMSESDEMKEDDMTKEDDMAKEDDMVEIMNDGEMAEMFELMTLDGDLVKLSDLKGEKVYVKFWASWCSICLSGLDELDVLSAMDNDFKVLTIIAPDYNGEQSLEKFKAWFEKQGHNNMTVLVDNDGDVTRMFGVRGYPTAAYIGSDGILVKTLPGHMGNDKIKMSFEEIK